MMMQSKEKYPVDYKMRFDPLNRHPRLPYVLHLFNVDHSLSAPVEFKTGEGLTWRITPFFMQRNSRINVDILIQLVGLTPGSSVKTRFALQQPGNERHWFDFTFDFARSQFFYRSALPVPTFVVNGVNQFKQHSHYRFLRSTEAGELFSYEGEHPEFKPEVPLHWEWVGSLPLPLIENNKNFLENINTMEDNKRTFMYWLFIDRVRAKTLAPKRDIIVWPKPTKTARYLAGRQISVDRNFYEPVWPNFCQVMDNADLLPKEDFDNLIDVLGCFYHAWQFSPHRMGQLVRTADKLGFFYFAMSRGCVGEFTCYTNSMQSAYVLSEYHPLRAFMNIKPNILPPVTKSFSIPLIFTEESGLRHDSLAIEVNNTQVWIVTMTRSAYMNVEYLNIMMHFPGSYIFGHNEMWQMKVAPKKKNAQYLKALEHVRVFNYVQKTFCFPTAWLWSDVVAEMGEGPYEFEITATETTIPGWKVTEVPGEYAVTGRCNAEIQCHDGTCIPVNREFLEHYCLNLENWEENPDGTSRISFPNFSRKEVLHFLDTLYHGSKYMTPVMWKELMKCAEFSGCSRVAEMMERAFIRMEAAHLPFVQLCTMNFPYLKFNIDMKKVLGIGEVEKYLRSLLATPAWVMRLPK